LRGVGYGDEKSSRLARRLGEWKKRERGNTGLTFIHQMIIRHKDDIILHLQTWMSSTDDFDIPSACPSVHLPTVRDLKKDISGLLTFLE